MAYVSTFGYTNKVVNSTKPIPVDVQPITNYARTEESPLTCVMNNITCPLDQGEVLSYKVLELDKVTSSQVLQNPAPVRNGVQYVVKLEEILRTRDAAGDIIMDEPIVAYLTIKHQKTGNITSAHIEEILTRLLGACMKTNGTYRFNDLMRSAVTPTSN